MTLAERLDSWSTPLTIVAGLAGLACWIVFGSLNHTTVKSTAPAGTFQVSQFYPGQKAASYMVASPRGIGVAAPIGGDTPDRSFVKTDRNTFVVRGVFLAAQGQALEVRTAVDKTSYLCVAGSDDGCHYIEPSDSIRTVPRAADQ